MFSFSKSTLSKTPSLQLKENVCPYIVKTIHIRYRATIRMEISEKSINRIDNSSNANKWDLISNECKNVIRK